MEKIEDGKKDILRMETQKCSLTVNPFLLVYS